jgi:Nuclease-related domain
MPVPTARVWRRYGQLRIYISSGDIELGWCDPRSGRFQLHQPEKAEDFWLAVRAECRRLLKDGQLADTALPPAAIAESGQPVDQRPARPQQRAPGPQPPGQPPDLPAAQPEPAMDPAQPAMDPAQPEPAINPEPALSSVPGGAHWIVRDARWDDLARNAPGESARARAKELRAQHPFLITIGKALGIRTTAESFAMGAKGEREVGRKLNRWAARNGWHVLHAVPVGRAGADIDHVVIAPFGVVTVNTKTTKTRVWVGEYGMTVGGKSVDYLRKSRAEARRAERLLGRAAKTALPVQAVIVFNGAHPFSVRRGGPPDVAVLGSPRALHRWLRNQPAVLSNEQVDAIYQAARNPATWHGGRSQPA